MFGNRLDIEDVCPEMYYLLGDNEHCTPFPHRPPMINRASQECATITLDDEVHIASLVQ